MAQDDQVQETHATTNGTNGTTSPTTSDDTNLKRTRHGSDVNAQDMVIASLRSQVDDLFSQVTQLNGKLVKSYDRVSDLEDNLHVAETGARIFTHKITELEAERTQHLAALNTGLLVERQHVTAELTRLMEKATEEAAQRGQAESARADIEKDLDDLSATLFDQANTMVAEARFARAQSERKVEDAETSLKAAEEAVAQMQLQMQALHAEKEDAQRIAEEMQITMGKGKWAQRQPSIALPPLRLLCSHLPYQEFLLFVAHLRTLHLSTSSPPAMSTLLPLPFISRLTNEDSSVCHSVSILCANASLVNQAFGSTSHPHSIGSPDARYYLPSTMASLASSLCRRVSFTKNHFSRTRAILRLHFFVHFAATQFSLLPQPLLAITGLDPGRRPF